MKQSWCALMAAVVCSMLAGHRVSARWPGDPAKCKPDAVKAGSVCMDKYEASVWQIPATNLMGKSNAGLIKKVQNGVVKLTDLTAGGATQISLSSSCSPAFPGTFPSDGQWTAPLYAVSVAGVRPTACVTWFQAQQACANSRKRLPTNGEWQLAVAGTQDPGGDNGTTDCNTASTLDAVNTGSRIGCISNYGAFDMVGNVFEWVGDWVPLSTSCGGSWTGSADYQCFVGASTSGEPGALIRGGAYARGGGGGVGAGPLAIIDSNPPSSGGLIGFRCAR